MARGESSLFAGQRDGPVRSRNASLDQPDRRDASRRRDLSLDASVAAARRSGSENGPLAEIFFQACPFHSFIRRESQYPPVNGLKTLYVIFSSVHKIITISYLQPTT